MNLFNLLTSWLDRHPRLPTAPPARKTARKKSLRPELEALEMRWYPSGSATGLGGLLHLGNSAATLGAVSDHRPIGYGDPDDRPIGYGGHDQRSIHFVSDPDQRSINFYVDPDQMPGEQLLVSFGATAQSLQAHRAPNPGW